MAVTPIHLARISHTLKAFNVTASIARNQAALYRSQTSLATGLRFVRPGEDPVAASSALQLDHRLSQLEQIGSSLRRANSTLTEVESTMQEALDIVVDNVALALQVVSDTTSPDERRALLPVVDDAITELIRIGNRRFLNTYLFGGHQDRAPFEMRHGGVQYNGDAGRMEALSDTDGTATSFTIPGLEFFNAVSHEVRGVVDLDPALTPSTLVSDLNGALGRGVALGRIVVSTPNSEQQIDLRGAVTIGDVVDRLNAALPGGVRAAVGTRGIVLSRPGPGVVVTIREAGGGRTAADLGLLGSFAGDFFAGGDLAPRLTLTTRISDLRGGTGLDLSRPIVVRNDGRAVRVALDGAQTVEDLLNRFNHADVGVWARISADGRKLDVQSRVSGVDFSIEEADGETATLLGIRSLHGGTLLSALNGGRGVRTVDGPDLRITTAAGGTYDIDVDGLRTVQELLDRINAQTGGAVVADLKASGNGIRIRDLTSGGGTFAVRPVNDSLTLVDLGLDGATQPNELLGRDVHLQRVDSAYTALFELREGMVTDDRQRMSTAAERLERVLQQMQVVQASTAAQAKSLAERADRLEAETDGTRIMLSDVRDVDFAEAVVRFQQLQTALQANLSTALQVLNLSVLEYLR